MDKNIDKYIVKSAQNPWIPLVENNICYNGVYVKSLKFDYKKNRSTTILLKFDDGASYPYHNHPAGEEIYVITGQCMIENSMLSEGDYLYTPPNFKHSVTTESGCILLLVIPEEVVKL